MKRIILNLILATLFLSSCQPRVITATPVAPRAIIVSESTLSTVKIANKVKESTKSVISDAKILETQIENGKNYAADLRKLEKVTAEQLEKNHKDWEAANSYIKSLEVSLRSVLADMAELEKSALYSANEANKLAKEAKESDKAIIAAKSQIEKQAGEVALGKTFRRMTYIFVSILAVAIVVFIASKVSKFPFL
jgi:endonuclease I